jgi:hypothetical protein
MIKSQLHSIVVGTLAMTSLMATANAAELKQIRTTETVVRKIASEDSQKTAFQKLCESIGKKLPKDYQPQYEPASKNSPQMCQTYSVGFAQPVGFQLVKAFNEACVSDGSDRVELAPSGCIDHLKTCVLNFRCSPND